MIEDYDIVFMDRLQTLAKLGFSSSHRFRRGLCNIESALMIFGKLVGFVGAEIDKVELLSRIYLGSIFLNSQTIS
jgi:hypothetical protein